MKGPDEDAEYWQTYNVILACGMTLYNLRVAVWPWLVDGDGRVWPPR